MYLGQPWNVLCSLVQASMQLIRGNTTLNNKAESYYEVLITGVAFNASLKGVPFKFNILSFREETFLLKQAWKKM